MGLGLSIVCQIIRHKTGLDKTSLDSLTGILIGTSSFTLGVTSYGLETYKAYKRTKDHIKEHGTLDPRFINTFKRYYCDRAGVELAAKEKGLENLI